MGLISKIEDKLSSSDKNTSSSHGSSNKLEKAGRSSYEGGSSSNNGLDSSTLRHPISSSASKNYGSATSGMPDSTTGGTYGSGTSGTAAGATSGMTSGTTSGVNRDGYGTQSASGYGNEGYGTGSSEYPKPMERMPGGYESSAERMQASDVGGNSSSRYDPYSRKGQQTAAGAVTGSSGTGYGSSTQAQDYASNDPNISRSKHGGVTNSMEDPRYGTTTSGSHGTSSTGQHHYGRDAALAAGGAGAAGLGGYEANKYAHRDQQPGMTSQQDPSVAYGQSQSTNPNDVSYMRSSGGTGQYEAEGRPSADSSGYGSTGTSGMGSTHTSGMGSTGASTTATSATGMSGGDMGSSSTSTSAGLSQAKKMGGAYERGYEDAMEHMKAEMEQMRMRSQ